MTDEAASRLRSLPVGSLWSGLNRAQSSGDDGKSDPAGMGRRDLANFFPVVGDISLRIDGQRGFPRNRAIALA